MDRGGTALVWQPSSLEVFWKGMEQARQTVESSWEILEMDQESENLVMESLPTSAIPRKEIASAAKLLLVSSTFPAKAYLF